MKKTRELARTKFGLAKQIIEDRAVNTSIYLGTAHPWHSPCLWYVQDTEFFWYSSGRRASWQIFGSSRDGALYPQLCPNVNSKFNIQICVTSLIFLISLWVFLNGPVYKSKSLWSCRIGLYSTWSASTGWSIYTAESFVVDRNLRVRIEIERRLG